MKKHEFYAKFANIPLDERWTVLDRFHLGDVTMLDVYKRIKQRDEKIAELIKEQDELLEIADKFIPLLTAGKIENQPRVK